MKISNIQKRVKLIPLTLLFFAGSVFADTATEELVGEVKQKANNNAVDIANTNAGQKATQNALAEEIAARAAGDAALQNAIDTIALTPGPQGEPGADGADGADGVNGADGADGADGVNGADGADGADGVNGADGADGVPGPQGEQGPSGVLGAYSVLGEQNLMNPSEQKLISVFCDPGDFPSGGGLFQWQANQNLEDIKILESTATGIADYPPGEPASDDNLPEGGWQVRVQYTGDFLTIVSATVQCLNLN